ncbi:hypothetical protein JCM31826_07480 [Thermaurantimonas aggregans]|uniref:Uncharacterized protein n=1 Tax=Thermaurantimonas aggregans TaxID=2173829 RepID=A0A401XJS5_9FLAO|nr:hypothetical protein [Thermaurantimonas aggregans]MCX8148919.1 hypothetical protein [Thermaurantimonas aggregans]GCD77266.1 hypothetical protein JCM31826_07480 [Thermaurantimonas aggregans]
MNPKVKFAVNLLLVIGSVFFAYKIYASIRKPIEFNEIRKKRYEKIIDRLNLLRDLQIEYRKVNGSYANDFDALLAFADTGKIAIEERKDSSFMRYDKVYQTDVVVDTVIIRVLGYRSVREALLDGKGIKDVNELRYIPFTDRKEFKIAASSVERNGIVLPTFEVSAADTVIFEDLKEEYGQFISKEKALILGSLTEPIVSGNW